MGGKGRETGRERVGTRGKISPSSWRKDEDAAAAEGAHTHTHKKRNHARPATHSGRRERQRRMSFTSGRVFRRAVNPTGADVADEENRRLLARRHGDGGSGDFIITCSG